MFGLLLGAGDAEVSESESELDSELLSLSLELDDDSELLSLLLLSLDELELSSEDELLLEFASTVIFILDGAISSSSDDSLSVLDGDRDFLLNRDLASRPVLVLSLTGGRLTGDLLLVMGDLDLDLDLCLCHLGLFRTGDRLYRGRGAVSNLSSQLTGDIDLDLLKFCRGLNGDLERRRPPKGDLDLRLTFIGDLILLLGSSGKSDLITPLGAFEL